MPTAFIDFWDAVDDQLMALYGIDTWDAGIECRVWQLQWYQEPNKRYVVPITSTPLAHGQAGRFTFYPTNRNGYVRLTRPRKRLTMAGRRGSQSKSGIWPRLLPHW
jgi:hypothetical protein